MKQSDAKLLPSDTNAERLAAIRLNHSPIVSSHPCSEASCEQAFLLRLIEKLEIASKMADHKWFDHRCQARGCQSLVIAQAAHNAALEEAAQIVRNRACGYMSLPSNAIFNAGLIVEDLSRLEQRIRSLSTKRDGT